MATKIPYTSSLHNNYYRKYAARQSSAVSRKYRKKNVFLFFLFGLYVFIMFLGLSPFLNAQNTNAGLRPGYFINIESGRPRFIQRLVWRSSDYTARYEVVIERLENGRFFHHLREFTNSLYIELSLPPGNYRFQIIPYDIFERPGAGSAWRHIEVRLAVQPEMINALPEIIIGDDGEIEGFIFVISGNNIVPGAEFFIRSSDGEQTILEILNFDAEGNARIFISGRLPPGEYELIIRNPGGLESGVLRFIQEYMAEEVKDSIIKIVEYTEQAAEDNETEQELVIEEDPEPEPAGLKPFLIKFSAAYSPLFPVYDNGIIGASARLGAVFLVSSLYLGPEIEVSWFGDSITAGLNLLALKSFNNQRFMFGFKLGAVGFLPLSQSEGDINIGINLGAFFGWRITNNIVLETGFNFPYLFTDVLSGAFFIPWVGVGIQF